jgi:hypothetical protein
MLETCRMVAIVFMCVHQITSYVRALEAHPYPLVLGFVMF